MRQLALPFLACSLTFGLVACDKEGNDTQPPVDEGGDTAQPEEAFVSGVDENTVGLGGVVRDTVGDEEPAAAVSAEDAPKYDTALDAGGLIGHLASGLAHDDDLAASKTTAELLRLAGETEGSAPSDFDLCEHAWNIMGQTYPDKPKGSHVPFLHSCKPIIERERFHLGVKVFALHAECILGATDLRGLDLCDAAESGAEAELHAKPHGDEPATEPCQEAIDHIAELMLADMAEEPEVQKLLKADIDGIKVDAVQVCHDEGTTAELTCIKKAGVLVDLEKCTGA
jgi:hypothetical protein